jgi:hypothetical protein
MYFLVVIRYSWYIYIEAVLILLFKEWSDPPESCKNCILFPNVRELPCI